MLDAARIGVTQGLLSRFSFTTLGGKKSGNLTGKVFLEKINQVSECHILNLTNIDEEEKKDQDSLMVTVELKSEEITTVKVAEEQSKTTISVDNGTDKEQELPETEANITEVDEKESQTWNERRRCWIS